MSKKISVMLIDDNTIDLFIHGEFIKQMNIASEISEYTFAKEALLFLQDSKLENWPHLILLDIHMPIMNGFDFLEKYAELPFSKKEKCKIIILSSSLDTGDIKKSQENLHVLELIEKPINMDKLKTILINNHII